MEQQKPWEEDAGRREGGTICVCVCVCVCVKSVALSARAPPLWHSQEEPELPPLLSAPPYQGPNVFLISFARAFMAKASSS